MLFKTATWLCWTRIDAGDAWITAVDELVACKSSCRLALFSLLPEVSSWPWRKELSASDNFFCWSREGRSLWVSIQWSDLWPVADLMSLVSELSSERTSPKKGRSPKFPWGNDSWDEAGSLLESSLTLTSNLLHFIFVRIKASFFFPVDAEKGNLT